MTKPINIKNFQIKFPTNIKNKNKTLSEMAKYTEMNNLTMTNIKLNEMTLTDNDTNQVTTMKLKKSYTEMTTNKLSIMTQLTTIIMTNQ